MTQKDTTLTKLHVGAAFWEGVLNGFSGPADGVEVVFMGAPVAGVSLEPLPGGGGGEWRIRTPIPQEALREGVHSFLIRERGAATALSHFSIVIGTEGGGALSNELRAEVDLLRQELELMKAAFRRAQRGA